MASLLLKGINLVRPREGWVPFLLLLVALCCLPAAALDAGDDGNVAGLIFLMVLAAIVGLRLARSRMSARQAAILGGVLGLCLAIVVAGRLVPPLPLLASEIAYAAGWLGDWRRGVLGWPLPFASAARLLWQQLNALGIQLWWWGQAALSSGQAQDRVILFLFGAFLAWAGALFATWQVYRRHSALVGLLPIIAATAILGFFRGGMALFWLVICLSCTLGLLATCHLWTERARWDRGDIDYPGELGTELTFTVAPWLLVILVVAALFPPLSLHPLRDAYWRLMDGPWSRVEQVAERFLGPIDGGAPTAGGTAGGLVGELPRSHLLGAGPELGKAVVLYVRSNDSPPPRPDGIKQAEDTYPRRYWRSLTYDTYTGLGWANSPLEARPLPPDQFLVRVLPSGSDLFQQFQRLIPGETLIYAANVPYRLDETVQAWWRTPGDLAQLTGRADRYSVVSRTAEPTTAELRARSPITSTLPAEIAERYLALPDTLPPRVLGLAHQVVGDALTRFDQARAIEAYLRTYPYTLDLPQPPADRDLVDYFLFDLQRGYCDYYASAMVVLARAVGIPARLATGYAQGTYDYGARHWAVTEQDAHSWVEVYFDGIGWVEFEPTAGLPALERPGGEELAPVSLPPLPRHPVRWWQQVPWGLVILGSTLLLLAAALLWLWRPHPALAPAELVRDRQARLLRWGARLEWPLRDGQTAHEYSQALGGALRARGQTSHLPPARQAGIQAPAEIERLAQAFAQVQYSSVPIPDPQRWQVRDLWVRLRGHLWWLWLAPLFKKRSQTETQDGGT